MPLDIPYKIFIAENEDPLRIDVVSMLAEKGFDVVGEKNPVAAIEVAERQGAELLLIGLEMPRLDGMLLIRKFRKEELFRYTPIIPIGKKVDKRMLADFKMLDIKDIVLRPVDLPKLLVVVEKYYRKKVIAAITAD